MQLIFLFLQIVNTFSDEFSDLWYKVTAKWLPTLCLNTSKDRSAKVSPIFTGLLQCVPLCYTCSFFPLSSSSLCWSQAHPFSSPPPHPKISIYHSNRLLF